MMAQKSRNMWHINCVCYINTIVVSAESTLGFTINRLSYHTKG